MPEHLSAPLADLDQMLLPETRAPELGNPTLPIAPYRSAIEQTIDSQQATIVVSATGTGKTTQIPQYLFAMEREERGQRSPRFETIICTQPYILAARETAKRIGDELVGAFGDEDARRLVGCFTSEDKPLNQHAPIRIMTDAVLTQMLQGGQLDTGAHVIIPDEIHVFNPHQENNLAYARELLARNPELRVVAASANMGDPIALARYFGAYSGVPATVLKLANNTNHPITDLVADDAWDEMYTASREQADPLGFFPGKEEIGRTMSEMHGRYKRSGVRAPEILGLHSDLSIAKQGLALARYDRGKIIASTNIAQTSITIPGIQYVIDSGLERRIELVNGVPVLFVRPTSELSQVQRRGRVGRTQPGWYVRAPLTKLGHDSLIEPGKDIPEIQRTQLDTPALRMAASGGVLTPDKYFHRPDGAELERSRKRLRRIGAIALSGEATELGLELLNLPLNIPYGRMVLSAESSRDRAAFPAEQEATSRILAQTVALASVLQTQGIVDRSPEGSTRWRELTGERMSDALQELEVFIASLDERRQTWSDEQFEAIGVISKRRTKAFNSFMSICERRNIDPDALVAPNHHDRRELIRHIITGTSESIFVWDDFADAYNQDHNPNFQLPRESTIRRGAQFVIGHAIGTQRGNSPTGREVNFKLVAGTVVTPGELFAADPQGNRVTTTHHEYAIRGDGTTVERRRMHYDETPLDHIVEQPVREPSGELREFLIAQAFTQNAETGQPHSTHVRAIVEKLQNLQDRTNGSLKIPMRVAKLQELARQRLPQHVINFTSLEQGLATLSLYDAIKPTAVQEILKRTPDVIHTYVSDSEEYSEYRITYKGGRAFVNGVTPSQEAAVRERLEEIGLTDYEIVLIKREKTRKAWREGRGGQDQRQDDLRGVSRRQPKWHHRRR